MNVPYSRKIWWGVKFGSLKINNRIAKSNFHHYLAVTFHPSVRVAIKMAIEQMEGLQIALKQLAERKQMTLRRIPFLVKRFCTSG